MYAVSRARCHCDVEQSFRHGAGPLGRPEARVFLADFLGDHDRILPDCAKTGGEFFGAVIVHERSLPLLRGRREGAMHMAI